MSIELAADVQERLAEVFGKLDYEIMDETFKLAEKFKLAVQAGDLREFVLSHRKNFPFSVQPQTGDLRELVLMQTKKWLLSRMDPIAAEWTKLSLDEKEFRSQMDRVEWSLLEDAVHKFAECCRYADDWTPANELVRYAEKELRHILAVRGRGWCRRNQARALVMTCHRGMPHKLEQDTETWMVASRKTKFEPTWASTKPVAKDQPDCVSGTDEPVPSDPAPNIISESEADSTASALAILEAAIITTTGQAAGDGQRSAVENTAALGVKSDATKQEDTKQRPGKARIPVTLIDGSVPRIEKAMSPGGDGEKKSVMLPAVVAEGPGPGRKANVEANLSIARVVESFGRNWRDRLTEVCDALDLQKLALPGSKKWKGKGCSDWTDVLSEDQEGLVKALQHRLDWVSEHPTDDPDQPRG
jgi:hypothetical protein